MICIKVTAQFMKTYKLLLKELLLSLSPLKKLTSDEVDSLKVAKLLLNKQAVSNDCVLIIDEMYLQKSVQYRDGVVLDIYSDHKFR